MSEPVMYSVPLEGYDCETRAVNAVVYLLEVCNFDEGLDAIEGQLNGVQKERIAKYLMSRYAVNGGASR